MTHSSGRTATSLDVTFHLLTAELSACETQRYDQDLSQSIFLSVCRRFYRAYGILSMHQRVRQRRWLREDFVTFAIKNKE